MSIRGPGLMKDMNGQGEVMLGPTTAYMNGIIVTE